MAVPLLDQLVAANRPELTDYQRELLRALHGYNFTANKLAAALGKAASSVRANLNELVDRGLVASWVVGNARWYTCINVSRRRK